MTLITLDVVLVLPEHLRAQALTCSELVSEKMRSGGSASHFRLGELFPDSGQEPCEPHVSLFMLTVDEAEVNDVLRAVERLAKTSSPLDAEGVEYRYNPHGAVEVYFAKSPEWSALQRSVIISVEPLRRGRLREVDPSGARIRDLLCDASQDAARRQQLMRYGYDEVADAEHGGSDRFNPHVTLAWPRDHDCHVALDDLPASSSFSGRLTELAVYGMSAYGTCTTNYGTFTLRGAVFNGVGSADPAMGTCGSRYSEGGFQRQLSDFR
jgi:hypothetical protein